MSYFYDESVMDNFKKLARGFDGEDDSKLRDMFHEAYEDNEISGSQYDYLIRILDGES